MATAEPHPGMRDALPVATVVLAAVAVVGLVTLAVIWLLWGQGFLHSFVPFPAEIVACANGMAYGPLWGTVLTWTGAMLGAFAAFGLSRKLGRPFVEMVVARRKWRTVDEWTARQGWQVMLVSRFTPVVAFNLINYAAGLTRISWSTFTWTTGLGILPLTVLMVVMGDNFDMLPLWGWLALFAVGLLFWIALRTGWRRRAGKASVGKNS
jgi:uncharacterized membrane protein YdjX (TVP38/TMEM64 family)